MLIASDIKKLPQTVNFINAWNQTWEGKTYDTMKDVVRKGYCTLFAAHSIHGRVTYKKCKQREVPLHCVMQIS